MNSPRSRSALLGYGLVLATLLVVGVLSYVNIRRLYAHHRLVEQDQQAIGEIAYRTAAVTALLSTGLGIVLATLGYALVRRENADRQREAQALQQSNQWLEQRVVDRTEAISAANAALRQEITERERAERQARLFADELQRSNRELEQFAAVASHDLQEPLRKIQAFGDRLRLQCRDELDGKGQDYLDRMLTSAQRMRRLIDDLLEYSRISTRKQPLVPVDLRRIAQEVVGDLDERLQQTHGRVEIDGLPTIAADPVQMRQLFQNLIGNALKFHRAGQPPVVCVTGRIRPGELSEAGPVASESQPGLRCELRIEDNGIGFEPAYTERIFELFQRLHGRGEYEGTGMGLAICKKIVERHGGMIAAASTPGEGSRFVVTLPVERAVRDAP